MIPPVYCLMFDWQTANLAVRFAWANAGSRSAARIAMMVMTTSSSISVKRSRYISTKRFNFQSATGTGPSGVIRMSWART